MGQKKKKMLDDHQLAKQPNKTRKRKPCQSPKYNIYVVGQRVNRFAVWKGDHANGLP